MPGKLPQMLCVLIELLQRYQGLRYGALLAIPHVMNHAALAREGPLTELALYLLLLLLVIVLAHVRLLSAVFFSLLVSLLETDVTSPSWWLSTIYIPFYTYYIFNLKRIYSHTDVIEV